VGRGRAFGFIEGVRRHPGLRYERVAGCGAARRELENYTPRNQVRQLRSVAEFECENLEEKTG